MVFEGTPSTQAAGTSTDGGRSQPFYLPPQEIPTGAPVQTDLATVSFDSHELQVSCMAGDQGVAELNSQIVKLSRIAMTFVGAIALSIPIASPRWVPRLGVKRRIVL